MSANLHIVNNVGMDPAPPAETSQDLPVGSISGIPADKVALITGGSRGLGRNTAEHLARDGVAVVITYHSGEADARAVVHSIREAGGRAAALPLNVANVPLFDTFIMGLRHVLRSHFGRDDLDFVVNNAGMGVHASFESTTTAQFDQLVDVHLKGPFFLTQQLLPLLRDGGRIVNVSSGLTRFAMPGYAAYAAMKGAMEVLTRYQAKELGARGITVNTVAPGAIETDFGGGAVRDNAQLNQQIAGLTALGRVGVPDDIGGAIAAMLSDGQRWVNGQRIEVSGGMLL